MATVQQTAPDFTLPGLDQRQYRLREALRQGPVLLAFCKSTCGTCKLAFPYLERLWQTLGPTGWTLWAIAQDRPDQAARFVRETGIIFPVLLDTPDYAVSRLYDPEATPTLYLIDTDGRIVQTVGGFSKDAYNALAADLARRLGREPVIIAPPDDGRPSFRPG